MTTTTRYRGVRDPREAGPGQVWVEETRTGMPGEEMRVRALDPRYDLRNHSPDGFQWGYAGSGPAQLALAILADALEMDTWANDLHQQFKREFVCYWQDRWMIDRDSVRTWAAARILAEQAAWAEDAEQFNREEQAASAVRLEAEARRDRAS
jgi:uncharacterized protein DUF6166